MVFEVYLLPTVRFFRAELITLGNKDRASGGIRKLRHTNAEVQGANLLKGAKVFCGRVKRRI